MRMRAPRQAVLAALLALSASAGDAQAAAELELGATRTVSFEAREGTWLSLDVAPDGQRLVFELLGDLYLLPIAGGAAEPLTQGMAFDSQPRFSPDGSRVVFVSDRDGAEAVWTIGVDGSEPRKLSDDGKGYLFASPAFSPDGSHVVVSRSGWTPIFELWAYHVDGGKGVQITKAKRNGNTPVASRLSSLGAVYSADGRYLYFARRRGAFGYNLSLPLWQLMRRDLLTGAEDYLTQAQGSAFRPLLAPDGEHVVYGTRFEQHTGLRIRNLSTGTDEWLVYPVERDDQESRFTRDLLPGYAFTPDGEALIYAAGGRIWRRDLARGVSQEIPFRAEVSQGLGPRLYYPYRLGLGPVKARLLMGPELSPDGSRLAFSAFLTLYVYDLDDGTLTMLSPEDPEAPGAKAFHPTWSADGRELAYVSWSSRGGGHIWRVRADGRGRPRRLTETPAYYTDPVFSPDGQRIVALRASSYDRLYRESDFGAPIGSDLIWIPRNGGPASLIAPSRGDQRPHFGPQPERIYVYRRRKGGGLTSFRFDGTDRREHLAVKGPGIFNDEEEVAATDVRLAPDGRHALVLHANQLYLIRLLNPNLTGLELSLASASLPVARLTDVGADFFGWSQAGERIFWTVGQELYWRPLASVEFERAAETSNGNGSEAPPGADAATAEAEPEPDAAIAEAHEAVRSAEVAVYRPRYRPEGTLALVGGTVLSMEPDAEPLADATVLVEGDRISAVGPSAAVTVPPDARVVDVAGRFVLPGFIDTHAHFRPLRRILDDQNWAFMANLAYGVTTGFDVQPSTTDILAYQDLIDAGLMVGPRALSTGPGVFSNNEFRSVAHAEAVLRRYKDHYGVRNLKAYLAGNRAQRQHLVEAAARLRLMPTTEGGLDMKLDLTHVIDGFSGNEHNFPLLPLYDDVVQLVARSGIAYTPTLLVSYGGPFAESYFYTRESPHADRKLRRFVPGNVLAQRTHRSFWVLDEEFVFADLAAQALKIVRAGGRVGVGAHGQLQGLGYHWEMRALAAGGFSPLQVLTAATRHGAEMVGVGEDLGTVSERKLADLVVLDADPLEDVGNTTRLRYVVRNGELFDAATLDRLWPRPRPLPEQWWWNERPPGPEASPP
jgi:Tol biopolymer transport system component